MTPGVVLKGETKVTAVVVGVVKTPESADDPAAIVLNSGVDRLAAAKTVFGPPSLEAWVPPEVAKPLVATISSEFDQALGTGMVNVDRSDYLVYREGDPLLPLKLGRRRHRRPHPRARRARSRQYRAGDGAAPHPGDRCAAQLRRDQRAGLLR